ncbi:MAG: YbaB/EbfC family nucleoid-associated protein [Haliscomenobacter sp.]|nr:YbaB/EbfC family nucleoid-associated protein [Haliscomenobacter sp.]MBK7477037.1 YbaB/EbfC family nucleoid-associated protein [Haliscomenobacter sp.]MBK8879609.1 YbaB/EbfC family nucleoid-associated protein [Haliscomenobacter sp.]
MFGNLFGDMEEMQRRLQEKLALIEAEAEAGEGAVKVTANGNREVVNIRINPDLLKNGDPEELEDLLVVAINRALADASEKGGAESQKMMKDLLPPGMDDLLG